MFQSTPLCEGRRSRHPWSNMPGQGFNPLPSARGDYNIFACLELCGIVSIHSPLRGETGCGVTSVAIYHLFQSTPLCEGRLRHVLGRIRAEGVSIHSPLRGETLRADHTARIAWFQSTPLCEGRPDLVKVVIPAKRVSIHSPLRGETQLQVVCQTASTCFNPLPSARGDTTPSLSSQFPQSFNPLPSARGDLLRSWLSTMQRMFQSTPLCEGRPKISGQTLVAGEVSIHSPLRGETAKNYKQ